MQTKTNLGDKQKTISALVELASQEIPETGAEDHLLRNNLSLRAFTTIIRADKQGERDSQEC